MTQIDLDRFRSKNYKEDTYDASNYHLHLARQTWRNDNARWYCIIKMKTYYYKAANYYYW